MFLGFNLKKQSTKVFSFLLHQRCAGVATKGARLGVAIAETRPSEQRAPKRSDP